MIPDDTNINPEDELEDDFEVDDDFDDGFEDDWDDGDEDASLDETDAASPAPSALAGGEKTFLQKFFIPIVLAVVALFGVLFILGQGLLSPADPPSEASNIPALASPDTAAATAEQASQTPMQNDVQSDTDVLPELPENVTDNPMEATEQPLTPLPGDDSAIDQNFELADLNAELEDSAEDPLSNDVPSLVDTNISDEDMGVIPEDIALESPANAQDIDDVPALAPNEIEATETLSMAAENTAMDELPAMEEEAPVETMTAEETAVIPSAAAPDMSAQKEEMAKLQSENTKLQKEISDSKATIESLRAEIEALKKDVKAAKRSETMKTVAKEEPANAIPEAIVDTIQPATKDVKPAKVIKPKTASPVTWVLKSAQPGKATIAQTGSGDLKTIEIGQTVNGLGKVQSIQVENGIWVVRGSRKTITQ